MGSEVLVNFWPKIQMFKIFRARARDRDRARFVCQVTGLGLGHGLGLDRAKFVQGQDYG
jgi:hypothetical protein